MTTPIAGTAIQSFRERLAHMPRLALGTYPTPVRGIELPSSVRVCIKDDAHASPVYGGNKVRKLECILAEARARGAHRIVAVGDINSHTLLACALHAPRAGFETIIVTMPARAPEEIAWPCLASGKVQRVRTSGFAHAIACSYLYAARGAYRVPLGASNTVSVFGYVHAVHELAEQIARGELPAPDTIYAAFGTGSTVAGILLGTITAGLNTRVIAVQTVEAPLARKGRIAALLRGAARMLGAPAALADLALQRLGSIDARWLGRGHGHSTPAAHAAVELLAQSSVCLDPVYTGKAMAALLSDAACLDRRTVLFWNTFAPVPERYRSNGNDH